jgi:hypothetical protein
MPSPVFYAEETNAGTWSWRLTLHAEPTPVRRSTGSLDGLLNEISLVSTFNPKPVFLANFSQVHDCDELSNLRSRIAKAANCSVDGRLCVEGTMAEYEAHL